MYKAKAHHPLSTPLPEVAAEVEKAMWGLFVAIGDAWRLPDQDVVETYHLRFDAFLENRIAIDPLNGKYYEAAAELIADLAAQLDLAAAYELIFFGDNPDDLEYIPALVSSLPEPKKLVIVDSADHFLEGRLREMRDAIEDWGRETVHA